MRDIEIFNDLFTEDLKDAVEALVWGNTMPTSFSVECIGVLRTIFGPGCRILPEVAEVCGEITEKEVIMILDKTCLNFEPPWVQEIIKGVIQDIRVTEKTTSSDTQLFVHLMVPSGGLDGHSRGMEFLREIRSKIRSALKLRILDFVGRSRTIIKADLEGIFIHKTDDLAAFVRVLCQGLRFNDSLKDLSLAQKELGNAGFQHLVDMLLFNSSLEHLNLRRTNMLASHLSQLASALERNINLSLTLSSLLLGDNPGLLAEDDGSHIMKRILTVNKNLQMLDIRNTGVDAVSIDDISSALTDNKSLKCLVLAENMLGPEGFKELSVILGTNQILQELDLSGCGLLSADLRLLVSALVKNSCPALRVLLLDHNPGMLVKDDGSNLQELLTVVTNLQELGLSNTGLNSNEGTLARISIALRTNTTLRKLNIGGNRVFGKGGDKHIGHMLRLNTGLQELGASRTRWKRGDGLMDAFSLGLESNSTLTHLDFSQNLPSVQLFKSLEKNKCLTSLNMELCDFDRTFFQQAIMDMLDQNTTLKELRLDKSTGLEDTDLARVRLHLKENALFAERKHLIGSMETCKPRFARVFLCGYPYAGKTTLRMAMLKARKLDRSSTIGAMMLHARSFSESVLGLRWLRVLRAEKTESRPRGIEVHVLEEDPRMSLSLWDLAGQDEYHAFHENLFPNLSGSGYTSTFLIICNLYKKQNGEDLEESKSAEDVQEECEYWLKLLASNSKQRPISEIRPRVLVLLNKIGSVNCRSLSVLLNRISMVVGRLRKQFDLYLDVVIEKDSVPILDASSVRSVSGFTKYLLDITQQVLIQTLQPEVPQASVDLTVVLSRWMLRHPSRPVITWHRFEKLCKENRIQGLGVQSKNEGNLEDFRQRCRAMAENLHDAGQIIYFDGLDIVVISPRWFSHSFLERLIAVRNDVEDTSVALRGVTSSKALRSILVDSLKGEFSKKTQEKLQNVLTDEKLIQLMLKLELCYESHLDVYDGDERFFVLPATLGDDELADYGRRKLQWPLKKSSDLQLGYLGRRVTCRDQICTFLTAGFFPRLQVYLYNSLVNLNGFQKSQYKVEKNLICFSCGSVDYIIECSGHIDFFVDILVRFPLHSINILPQVRENVIGPIQEFCASHHGCQGVDLLEGVVRTSCVENLHLCRNRRNQSALLSDLVQEMEVHGSNYLHRWPADVNGVNDSENVLVLLGVEDAKSETEKWFKDLEDAAEELKLDFVNQSTLISIHCQFSSGRIPEALRERLNRLSESEGIEMSYLSIKIDQMIAWQDRLLSELSRRLDRLNSCTVLLHNQQFPKLPYFTYIDVNKVTKMVTEMCPWLAIVRVHFMCEAQVKGKPHLVSDQPGRPISLRRETLRPWWPYLAGALTVLNLMMKAGAQQLIGSGAYIPAFSTRAYWKEKEFWDCVGEPEKDLPQWLVENLAGRRASSLYDDFLLHKVQYNESGQVAWICEDHLKIGEDCGSLRLLQS